MTSRDETSPGAILGVVGSCFVLTALGYSSGGFVGAAVGGGAGAALATMVVAIVRVRRAGRALTDRPLPQVDGLAPEQAVAVLGALTGGTGKDDVLGQLARIRKDAEDDPRTALRAANALHEQRPRNPAVVAEIARLSLACDDLPGATSAMSSAIVLAIGGGMNPMAAKLFDEFRDHRAELAIERAHLHRLLKILEGTAGKPNAEGARWVRDRLAAVDDPEPPA